MLNVPSMDWAFLRFLGEPWFVIPWYAIGLGGMAFVIYDLHTKNTALKKAMSWAWPIIVLFFSVVGLALYFFTARAPRIGEKEGDEKQKAHNAYERNMVRRVNGAVIHCVAGDGLGIMTGMVIARSVGMSFWQEFWFEYLCGFLLGWLIFQLKSMTMMYDSKVKALGAAFRGEFFSMLTVMAGMGAVMTYVTPMVTASQPKPDTFAFWGFGMFGLMVGYLATFPMNWMMVKIGWKHGMGGMEGAKKKQVETAGAKYGVIGAMVVLGAAALVLPAWLTEVRNRQPVEPRTGAASTAGIGGSPQSGLTTLGEGLRQTLQAAADDLAQGRRSHATVAMDAARRAVEVGAAAAPDSAFKQTAETVRQARHSLFMGNPDRARQRLLAAAEQVRGIQGAQPRPADPGRFHDVTVINARGEMVGEISKVQGDQFQISLGGSHDVWGFLDFGSKQTLLIPASALVFGPSQFIGSSLVALPRLEPPRGR